MLDLNQLNGEDLHQLFEGGLFQDLNKDNISCLNQDIFSKYIYHHLKLAGYEIQEVSENEFIIENKDKPYRIFPVSYKLDTKISYEDLVISQNIPFLILCPFHYNGRKVRNKVENQSKLIQMVNVPIKVKKIEQISERYLAKLVGENEYTNSKSMKMQLEALLLRK